MRVAPPVRALSCGAGTWHSLQQLLFALSAAVATWWTGVRWGEADAWLALVSLLAGIGAALASARLWPTPPRSLAWDGSAWQLGATGNEPRVGQAEPRLDLGHWMLVRFTPVADARGRARPAVWLPLSRRDAPAAWAALRVALHAPQPTRRAA